MVQLKRKVTIKKKVGPQEPPAPNPPSKPKWLIAAVAVLALFGAGYLLIPERNPAVAPPEEKTEVTPTQTAIAPQTKAAPVTETAQEEPKAAEQSAENAPAAATPKEEPATEEPKGQKNAGTPVENKKPTTAAQPAPKVPVAEVSSSVEENALRTIRGEFGNGLERKEKLGDKYAEIQRRVNEMYKDALVK